MIEWSFVFFYLLYLLCGVVRLSFMYLCVGHTACRSNVALTI